MSGPIEIPYVHLENRMHKIRNLQSFVKCSYWNFKEEMSERMDYTAEEIVYLPQQL